MSSRTTNGFGSRVARVATAAILGSALHGGLGPAMVHAQSPQPQKSRVVLVTNHADAQIVPLLKAELERLGLDVMLVDHGDNEVVPRDLRRAAKESGAVAGFRVLVSMGTVEVWIADRVTGKIMLREILAREGETKVSETLVVTRSVELLRASLLELEAPYPPRGEVAPTEALTRLAREPKSPARYTLQLGVGILYSPSAANASTHVATGDIAVRIAPWRAVSIGVEAMLPFATQTIDGAGVRSTVATRWYGLDVQREALWFSDRIHVSYGVGVALLDAVAQGNPAANVIGRRVDTVSPTPFGLGSASFFLTPMLRVRAELIAGASLRPLYFSMDGRRIGQVGPAIGVVTAALEVILH